MAYVRQGTCNRCGECCGDVRASGPLAGGRNNPWPINLVSDVRTWLPADVEFYLPIFKWIDRAKQSGRLRVGEVNSPYVFSTQYGLVKSDAVPECPALLGQDGDEVRPCGLIGTAAEEVYTKICQYFPPSRFETQAQKQQWTDNCPSCSYTWLEIVE